MTGNRRLFTSYKAYDGGHFVLASNLKGKVVSGGNITHDSIPITNVEYVSCLAFNLINVGPFTSQSTEIVERTHHKLRKMSRAMLDEQSMPQNFWCHAKDTKTYIFNKVYIRNIINKTPYEILRNRKPSLEYFRVFGYKVSILNSKVHLVKFDPKSYEENDRINKPIVQDLNGSSSLQVNVLDEGYPKSLKEAKVPSYFDYRDATCFSCLNSRSIISIGSSIKLSLSSSRSSFIRMTRDSSDRHFFRLEAWKDSCMIKSLKSPNSGNQLQFLIHQVPLGRTSNALSIPRKFSASMFSSLIASDGSKSHNHDPRAILTNDIIPCATLSNQGYAKDFYDQ
nr:retrotransposon protein [Tanacetum cinerariifolium]